MDIKKIAVAREFVEMHKQSNLDNWQPFSVLNENKKLGAIYDSLSSGLYGEVRINELADDDFELEVEIDGLDSKSGTPVLFCWVDDGLIENMQPESDDG